MGHSLQYELICRPPPCYNSVKAKGWRQKDIAVTLGVSEGAVSQWLKRGRAGGCSCKCVLHPIMPRVAGHTSRVLLRKLSGKIIVIWDGLLIHRGHEIKAFLKRGAAKRLHLEQLPGYEPDLNPDEGIWNYR